jgi:predicted dehydrogenase
VRKTLHRWVTRVSLTQVSVKLRPFSHGAWRICKLEAHQRETSYAGQPVPALITHAWRARSCVARRPGTEPRIEPIHGLSGRWLDGLPLADDVAADCSAEGTRKDDMSTRPITDGFDGSTVRYAVVGAGHVARTAILPAFAHAHSAELVAIVSDDPAFRDDLQEHHRIAHAVDRDGYDDLLDGVVDAVYLTAPTHLRCELAVRAAQAGVHVLCEQPMAVTVEQAARMVMAAEENDVLLMVAHRPDFERANIEALDEVDHDVLGEVRFFESTYSQSVGPSDLRLRPIARGGGALFELGVYCVHAARELLHDEPVEVIALRGSSDDSRFRACDQTSAAILRFPGDRLATFTVGFGTTSSSGYRVVGTEGLLEMRPAYEYGRSLSYTVAYEDGARIEKTFEQRDPVAPELIHFSRSILHSHRPHPDGSEGLADVRILCALQQSADEGRPVHLAARTSEPVRAEPGSPLAGLF